MGEVFLILKGNGIYDLLCEGYQERKFMCTIGATHLNTGKYLWYKYETTVEMTSDDNDKTVDIYGNQYEV